METSPSTPTSEIALAFARLIALAVIPFLYVELLAEQRELPRHVLLAFVAFGGLAVLAWQGRLRIPNALATPLALVFVALVLSSAAAPSPLRSWLGPYDGHHGALTWVVYAAWVVTTPSQKHLSKVMWLFVAQALVQAIIGLAQFADGTDVTGTIGHQTFFSAYTAPAAVCALATSLDERRRWRTVAMLLVAMVILAAMLLSGRRASQLAFLVGVAVLGWYAPNRRRFVSRAGALVAVGVLVFAFVRIPTYHVSPAERWTFAVDRSGAPSGQETVGQRMDYYRVGLEAAIEAPWIGRGFGAFRDVYAERKSTAVVRFESRAHSIAIEVLLATGLVGLVGFLWLFWRFARGAHRVTIEARAGPTAFRTAACFGVLLGHVVYLCFNFDQPAVAAWVFALAAFVIPFDHAPRVVGPRRAAWMVVAAAGLALTLYRLPGDFEAARGVAAETRGDLPEAILHYRSAVDLTPHECLYTLKLVTTLRATAPRDVDERKRHLRRCVRLEPSNSFLHYHLGFAHRDDRTGGATAFARGLAAFDEATQLAPHFAMFRQGKAQALAIADDPAAALVEIDAAIALEPDDPGLHSDRGNILRILGRNDEARKAYTRAIALDPNNELYQRNRALIP